MVLTLAIVFGIGVLLVLFTISSRLLDIDKKTREVTDRLDQIVKDRNFISKYDIDKKTRDITDRLDNLDIVEKTREITDRLDKIVEALDYISDSMPDEFRQRNVDARINATVNHYLALAAIPLKTRLATENDSPPFKLEVGTDPMVNHYLALAAIPLKTRLATLSDSPPQSGQEPTHKSDSEKRK